MRSGAEIYSILQFDLFIQSFLFSVNPDNNDSIHDYRVAAKRIHSLHRMIKSMHSGNGLARYFEHSGIKKSFNSGGDLREITINISILQDLEIILKYNFRSFNKFLHRAKKHAEKKLRKTWTWFPYDTFFVFKVELVNYLNRISPAKFDKGYELFLQSKVANIKTLINAGELDQKLHRARKIIKDIKYGFEMASVKVMKFGENKMTLHQVTILEDRIGNWHDWLIFSSGLKLFLDGKKNKKTLNVLMYNDLLTRVEKKLLVLQKSTSKAIIRLFHDLAEKTELSTS